MEQDLMVWVDLETTGLDPEADVILELGMRVTDWQGAQVARYTTLICEPGWNEMLISAQDVVREMHSASGLTADLNELPSDESLQSYEADSVALDWLKQHVPEGQPMCGSSVHLDRWFLLRHMPALAGYFGYRLIDVSGIREAMKLLNPALYERTPEQVKVHRPQADIDNSIVLWGFMVDNFFWM